MTSASFLHNFVYVIIRAMHFESHVQFEGWWVPVMVTSSAENCSASTVASRGQRPQHTARWDKHKSLLT
jgi:hypothetical protein